MTDNRAAGFSAEVVEVVETGGRDVGSVDPEGGVKGKDSTKDDVSKVGAATGIGAIVGAIIGGGKGAAIGAAVGGAAGTGRILTKRGQDIRLDRGQLLRIRTSAETQVSEESGDTKREEGEDTSTVSGDAGRNRIRVAVSRSTWPPSQHPFPGLARSSITLLTTRQSDYFVAR